MSDVIILCMGIFVSLVVASAVGVLFWGAANEPQGGIIPAQQTPQPEPQTPSGQREPAQASAKGVDSRSTA